MAPLDSYTCRPAHFHGVDRETWEGWRWQQQHAVRTLAQLEQIFPTLPQEQRPQAAAWAGRGYRYQLTPHILAISGKDTDGNPLATDPVWRQFFPSFRQLLVQVGSSRPDEYSAERENWEFPTEMLTPICHWKYTNRVIIYTAEVCLAYCNYCFRSLQSTDERERHGGIPHWNNTIEVIREHPEIEEVILSGGDPLVYDNDRLERMLRDLRGIPTVKAIRIHSRAFTHNPYRIDQQFCGLLKRYGVTEMSVHLSHPQEATQAFEDCLERIRTSGARTLLLGQTPLLKGINDDAELLHELFMTMYVAGVKPYYLLHSMPNVPAAVEQRTSVRRGAELMKALKRHMSNTACPEYIIVHRSGKRTVPPELAGTSEFIYDRNTAEHPIIRFLDWRGHWQEYLDGVD